MAVRTDVATQEEFFVPDGQEGYFSRPLVRLLAMLISVLSLVKSPAIQFGLGPFRLWFWPKLLNPSMVWCTSRPAREMNATAP